MNWVRLLSAYALALGLLSPAALSQRGGGEGYGTGPQLITVGGGPGNIEQQVAAIDFAQMKMNEESRRQKEAEERLLANQELVASGAVSALDLAAPYKAVHEYNLGIEQLRNQHSTEAITHLQKAIAAYPKFVSAHSALGLVFSDMDDNAKAKSELEAAIQLDSKCCSTLLNLGRLQISEQDFAAAEESLTKAVSVRPKDAAVLTALAYAQNGKHEYQQAIDTVARLHGFSHSGMGNAHYVAAAAALAMQDLATFERELTLFLNEDPDNPLAASARQNLGLLSENTRKMALQKEKVAAARQASVDAANAKVEANRKRLNAQLAALSDDRCPGCELEAANSGSSGLPSGGMAADVPTGTLLPSGGNGFTIRKVVDEVALFFAVSTHGHMVNDLALSDIQIRDDGKPPAKILQFAPQSKLPLRVGLLIDTSGSVKERFGFEKHAAGKFLEQLLNNSSDLAFVAGFSTSPTVAQDFTANHDQLGKGIESLKDDGGTALFDAVSYACGKLAAYPEQERVAKVLVVLSDGEDNSSHTTLRRSISDAEMSGVTIYTISTKDTGGDKTDADKVLEALAERSGGEALFPEDSQSLQRSFDKLRDIIRSRYLIAYRPADFEANGKYRTISVAATKNGSRLQVHTRKGYHARVGSPEAF
jgi:VWFA-related protein